MLPEKNMSVPIDKKLQIIRRGKPRPLLPHLQATISESSRKSALKGKIVSRSILFNVAYYDEVKWLTGCNIRQALFCWYCVLFESNNEIWTKKGFKCLRILDRSIKNHEKSLEHLQCALNLAIFLQEFGEEDIISAIPTTDACQNNRNLARRMIDVICFSVSEIKPATKFGERSQRVAKDSIENLKLYRDYDILNSSIIENAIELLQTTPKIVDDIASAISTVMMKSIEKELHESSYVSLIVSGHSKREKDSEISVVLRYLKNGKVCERFVRFYNKHLRKKSMNLIEEYVTEVINCFKIAKKVISVSLDAALMHIEYQIDLESRLLSLYPQIIFVPTCFDKLSNNLLKSLSFINELDVFFKKLSLLSSCFQEHSNVRKRFEAFLTGRNINRSKKSAQNIDLCMSDLTISAHYFHTLKTHRNTFALFLESILNSNPNTVAVGAPEPGIRVLHSFLKSVKTFFILEAMIKFLKVVQPFIKSIENQKSSFVIVTEDMLSVHRSLKKEGDIAAVQIQFETLWNKVIEFSKQENITQWEDGARELVKKSFYSNLYWDIFRCISAHIRYQIKTCYKREFFGILNFQVQHFPLDYMKQLKAVYKNCNYFDFKEIAREKEELLSKPGFSSCESGFQMMDILYKFDLKHRYPNVYSLSELLSTMPCSSSDLEDKPHKLNHIQQWCYASNHAAPEDNFSTLCIERKYLEEIRQEENFYDAVVAQLNKNNIHLQLQ